MTKNLLPIVLGLMGIFSPIRADDITLTDGTVLKNAKIVQQDDANKTVTIAFSGGIAQVHSAMVPATFTTGPQPAVTNTANPSTSLPEPPTPASPSTPVPKDWTVDGRDYHNVTVTQVDADRVHIMFDGGLGTLMLADLPPDLKKAFNFDPDAAKKAQVQREADQQASERGYAALDAARAKEEAARAAKEATATRLANRPKAYLMGAVLQKVPDVGLLVDCEMPEVTADSSASIGGGGNVYVPQTGCPKGVNQAYGTFLLTGYPNEASLVDGSAIKTVAFANGTYSYTSVTGANKTVASYAASAP